MSWEMGRKGRGRIHRQRIWDRNHRLKRWFGVEGNPFNPTQSLPARDYIIINTEALIAFSRLWSRLSGSGTSSSQSQNPRLGPVRWIPILGCKPCLGENFNLPAVPTCCPSSPRSLRAPPGLSPLGEPLELPTLLQKDDSCHAGSTDWFEVREDSQSNFRDLNRRRGSIWEKISTENREGV